jgi:hypothetical protein
MTGTSLTINGNLHVGAVVNDGTGLAYQFRLSGSSATFPSLFRTYYIHGDLIADSARSVFTFCGSGTANTGDSVYVDGDVKILAGQFRYNAGSGASGWLWCGGDFVIGPGVQMTRSSSSLYPSVIYFTKNGRQSFINNGTISTGFAKPFAMFVNSGSIFNTGTGKVTGGINFTLRTGATLETAHAGGVDSAIQVENGSGATVTKTFEEGSSYIFNGSVAQVTGSTMPKIVGDLTIDNASGVTLTDSCTVNGVLHLKSGVFNNTMPLAIGPIGSISYEGGSLLIPLSVNSDNGAGIPGTFFVDQNYPNPFNPSTTIRFGLPGSAHVSAKLFSLIGQEIATVFEGRQEAGVHELTVDASSLSTGVYLCRIQADKAVIVKRVVVIK